MSIYIARFRETVTALMRFGYGIDPRREAI